MLFNLNNGRSREGVAPWVSFATIVGILALILSMMTIVAPAQASADEADTAISQEDTVSPAEDDTVGDLADSINSLNKILDETNKAATVLEGEVATFNSGIVVDVEEISVENAEKELEVGDTFTVYGTWDTTLAKEEEGTLFWVTFPAELELNELPLGYEKLTTDAGEVIGFSFDTAQDFTTGDWEVEATLVGEADYSFLNFRTSADAELDVAVDLPNGAVIDSGARAVARSISPLAAGDDISVTVDSILKTPALDPVTQLQVGDKARVEGTWDASHLAVTGGETFNVGFPAELSIPAGFSFNMVANNIDGIDDGTVIGNCVVNADNSFTCELNDTVAGKEDVKGSWWIEAGAVRYTNAEELSFKIPGNTITVPLPGNGGGIDDGSGPLETKKSGAVLADKKSIKWTVDIAGPLLAPLAVGKVVTLEDTLSEALKLCEPSRASQFKLSAGRPGQLSPAGDLVITANPADAQKLAVTLNLAEEFRTDYIYRIEYITCATDGNLLQAVAADDDTYANAIVIGDKTYEGGIGKYDGWKPQVLGKTGGLLGGKDRFQKARWNITENGAKLVGLDEITITDTFGPNQEVCEGGLSISVREYSHLPVWNEESGRFDTPSVNVTNQFTGTTIGAKGDTSFSATLKSVDGFEFKENAYYSFTYDNCLTTGKIPDAGSKFENKAVFNGAEIKGSANAPGTVEKKSGKLNTSAKDVAGVSQPAGTTLDWTITVSGQKFEDQEELVITDEFSDTMAVCAVPGKTLKEQLNFKLMAVDFVGNGGLTSIDLTAATEVSLDGRTLAFTLDKDAFGGVHFSRDYNYELTYTLCTSSGGLDAQGTTYKNKATATGNEMSQTATQNWNGGADGSGVSRGSFSLLKEKSSESVPFGSDLVFTVKAEEFAPVRNDAGVLAPANLDDPNVKPTATYEIKIKADGTPVSGHYNRGNNWQIRLTEIGFPENSGFAFGPGKFLPGQGVTVNADGSQAIVAIIPSSNVGVKLQNTATRGGLKITKQITGNAADSVPESLTFSVNALIDLDGNGTVDDTQSFNLLAGIPKQLNDLPIGAKIKFTENQPANTETITWGTPVFSPAELTIGTDPAANIVTLTNTAETALGTFDLRKVIQGTESDNPNLPTTYKVKAEWDGGSKDLSLLKDGTVVGLGLELPAGTEVTLTEEVPGNGNNLEWAAPAFSGNGVSIVDGKAVVTIGRGNAELTVTNTVVEMGTLRIAKTLAGEAVDGLSTDLIFTVKAEWKLPKEDNFHSKDLQVKADGTPVELGESLPTGTEVRFTETAKPNVPGIEWGTVTWNGDSWLSVSGLTATGIVSDDPAEGRLVTLTNEAVFADRPVSIKKSVEGEAANLVDPNLRYVVQATFPATGEVRSFNIAAGNAALIGNFPVGTQIEFSEVAPADTDQITWGEPVFTPGNSITVGEDDLTVEIGLTNIANPTFGTFEIKKFVTGPEQFNENVPATIDVRAEWTDSEGPKNKILTLPTNGSPIGFGEALLNGTKVKLTEIVPADGNGIAWGLPVFSGDVEIDGQSAVVTIGKDVQNVKLKNYADTNTGTLRILKGISGEAAEAIADDVKFTVEATWNDGSVYQTRTLEILPGQTTELGEDLPVGTEVTFKEINLPQDIPGVEWGSITWGTNPEGNNWLKTNADGTATGIVSDDPNEGRLITLTNEALWKPGAVSYEKYIFVDGVDEPIPATEADLPEGVQFEVRIENIELPAGKEIPADAGISIGDIILLNAENNFYWESAKVLPKGTKITFGELEPAPLPGMDFGLPFYYVVADATDEPGDRNVVEVEADEVAEIQIRNRPIPTTEVEVDKIVTGLKGKDVMNDDNALFQVTASWTDIDGFEKVCVLNVVPGESAVPTENCDATILDGKVQFPLNTEIIFNETGARTDVSNVKWNEVVWTVAGGKADLEAIEGSDTAATVILTGDPAETVTLGLENKTSSNGMIIIPIPIPELPEFPVKPDVPVTPDVPVQPETSVQPGTPGSPESVAGNKPGESVAGNKPASGGLASTGANVLWLSGGALLLLAGGTALIVRGRKNKEA